MTSQPVRWVTHWLAHRLSVNGGHVESHECDALRAENTELRLTLSRSDSDEMQLLRAENEQLKGDAEAMRLERDQWQTDWVRLYELHERHCGCAQA